MRYPRPQRPRQSTGYWPDQLPAVVRSRPPRYVNRRDFERLERYNPPTFRSLMLMACAIEELTHDVEPGAWAVSTAPVDADLFKD